MIVSRFLIALFILISVSTVFGALDSPEAGKKLESYGSFKTTFYDIAPEKNYPIGNQAAILDVKGGTISKVHEIYKKALDMEGTGQLLSGTIVNYALRINNEIRYRISSVPYGWGVGQCPLRPYRTIAVDPKWIPLGSQVFIPKAQGIPLPDGTVHNGIFYAEDIGSAIENKHIDLFTAFGEASAKPFIDAGIVTKGYVDVYKFKDADPAGCHTKDPLDMPTDKKALEALVAAKVQALVNLADESIAQGDALKAQYAFSALTELRPQWERAGKPTASRQLVAGAAIKVQDEFTLHEKLRSLREYKTIGAPSTGPKPTGKYPGEWNGSTLNPTEIILTFDDGPHKELTPEFFQFLKSENVPATFFELGENVEKMPEITLTLAQNGFSIGNHTYDHSRLTELSDEAVASEIDRGQMIISNALGGPVAIDKLFSDFFGRFFSLPKHILAPEFFRSPYGARDERVLKQVYDTEVGTLNMANGVQKTHLAHFMWTEDSLDWQDQNPVTIEKRVFDELATFGHKGIILFHDIHPQTLAAIKKIVPRLKKEGYKIIPLYQLYSR